jgi:hypothetical protein
LKKIKREWVEMIETIKYNEWVSIDITEKNITVYENREREFTAKNYSVNKILLQIEIEESFADITYFSKTKKLMVCKKIKSITNLLNVDKQHLIKKVMEVIKNDFTM